MDASGAPGTRRPRGDHSLTRRLVGVSALLSAVIGTAFFLLALAIDALRDSESRANHALEVLVAANRLERLVIDVETAQRGFIITGEPSFLQPWYRARAAYAEQAAALERLARAGDAGQGATGASDHPGRGLVHQALLDSARGGGAAGPGRRADRGRDRGGGTPGRRAPEQVRAVRGGREPDLRGGPGRGRHARRPGPRRGVGQRRGLDHPHPALRGLPVPVGGPAGPPGVGDGGPRGGRGSHRADARGRAR